MKPGTPGFIGVRLREAREARGLSAISLADLIGVSRQAVSQYELGSQSPRPEITGKLAQILQLPEAYFRYPLRRHETGVVFYRSMSAATKTARTRSERRYLWLQEIVAYLREFVQFPQVCLPNFDMTDDPTRISYDQIEEIAVKAREFWKLNDGPISNVVWLLENNGAIVARDELGAETLDAFSEYCVVDGTPYIFLGSDKGVAVRSRFDAAHELGHIILHRKIDKTRLGRMADHHLIETQAHRFAGAFLLPAKAFANDFYSATLDALKALKPKWRVSIAMMIKRAEDLNFISHEQAKRLWINYSRRGWRTREPLDDELEIEQPRLLQRSFELLVNENIQTRDAILLRLPLNPKDIEGLSGLTPGYITNTVKDQEPPISVLGMQTRPRQSHQQPSSPAHVIQFPSGKTRI